MPNKRNSARGWTVWLFGRPHARHIRQCSFESMSNRRTHRLIEVCRIRRTLDKNWRRRLRAIVVVIVTLIISVTVTVITIWK